MILGVGIKTIKQTSHPRKIKEYHAAVIGDTIQVIFVRFLILKMNRNVLFLK